jgi:5-methyltetrahydropteroyltriglutamate--homocysteine methyltransferase
VVVTETIRRVVREQEDAGVDLPTDGQIQWDDLVTPFARNWQNTRPGGLIRFFDNNVYYRRVQVDGPIRCESGSVSQDYREAKTAARGPLKALLPGPLTLAMMSDDHHYGEPERLVSAAAAALRQEAGALVEAGAQHLQIDEPFLSLYPEQMSLLAEALSQMLAGVSMSTTLALYFHSIEPLVPALWSLPVDGFAIDCVSDPANLERALGGPSDRALVFGIVDARNTGRESEAYLRECLMRITAGRPAAENWVSPNAALEFLPHANVATKLCDLSTAVRGFNAQAAKG